MRSMTVAAGARSGALAVLVVCLAAGCSSGKRKEIPATHPVSGKVTYKDGKPVAGGVINFQPVSGDTQTSTAAEIQSDGSFTLFTNSDKERVEGAPPGEYQVTVTPPQGGEQANLPPVTLNKTCKVPEGGTTFTFTIDAPPKR